MDGDPKPAKRAAKATESLLILMACASPWAFGAVEAWATAALDVGVVLLAFLGAFATGRDPARRSSGACLPAVALLSLALLGLFQATTLPRTVMGEASSRPVGSLSAWDSPVRVIGDPEMIVRPPAPTISLLPEESILVAWRFVAAWIVFRSVIGLRGGAASLRRFGTAIALNATLLALFAMIQALTWNGKIYWFRASPQEGAWSAGGPFVCHSHLAAYLNLGLGFALAFIARPGASWKGSRLWASYGAAVMAVGIVASQSRSGFVAMIAGLLGIACLRPGSLRRYAGASAAVAGVGALLMMMLPGEPMAARLTSILDPSSSGYTARFEIWGRALRAFAARPIWGAGLGSFGVAIGPFGRHDRGVFFARAEDEYLDLLVEGGLVGVGLAALGLVGSVLLARKALNMERPSGDRLLTLGAVFGLATLMTQSLGDFAPHVPAIAITATILTAHVCGLGLDAGGRSKVSDLPRQREIRPIAVGLATVAVAIGLVAHDLPLVRAESALTASDLPLPGTSSPSPRDAETPHDILEGRLTGLERALHHRPDWAEGHLRRALTLAALYERTAAKWIEEATGESGQADLLWLHRVMHPGVGNEPPPSSALLEHDPIRRYLVPAARSYLEAVRCGPGTAMPHAGLASLDYLLINGESSAAYARRAFDLAGSDRRTLLFVADVAAQAGDLRLTAQSWRRSLEADEGGWQKVAVRAAVLFTPEEILHDVLPPGGRLPLLFADQLYAQPVDRAARDRFLRAAIERTAEDAETPAERLLVEALAREKLGDRVMACHRLESALALEPRKGDWRELLGDWLIALGRPDEAHRQARIGLYHQPGHVGLIRIRDVAAEARARGVGVSR